MVFGIAHLTDYQHHEQIFHKKLADLEQRLYYVLEAKDNIKRSICNLLGEGIEGLDSEVSFFKET